MGREEGASEQAQTHRGQERSRIAILQLVGNRKKKRVVLIAHEITVIRLKSKHASVFRPRIQLTVTLFNQGT